MKSLFKFIVNTIFVVVPFTLNSQNIGDILNKVGGGGSTSDILGSVIEGVFTKSNLSVADLAGEYESDGPAVTFKSENLLSKAGGLAGAGTIESKLKPYYEKFGLTGMTLNIADNGSFDMKIKGVKLNGNITKNESEGTFDFNITVGGKNIGKFGAYVEKSGSTLKIMFDATKLKDFISTVSKFTGNSIASSVGSILDGYDGACVGFRMVSVGSSSTTDAVSSGVNALKGLIGK